MGDIERCDCFERMDTAGCVRCNPRSVTEREMNASLRSQLEGAVERIEDLEDALAWALAYIDRPDDVNAEEQENYDGAERVLDASGGRA